MKRDLPKAIASQFLLGLIFLVPATLLVPSAPLLAQETRNAGKADNPAPTGSPPDAVLPRSDRHPDDAEVLETVDDANRLLDSVARKRAEIERTFAMEQARCREYFFMASCLEEAEERRRLALQPLRPIEARANTFKRRLKARQRSRSVENRREQQLDQRKGTDRLKVVPNRNGAPPDITAPDKPLPDGSRVDPVQQSDGQGLAQANTRPEARSGVAKQPSGSLNEEEAGFHVNVMPRVLAP